MRKWTYLVAALMVTGVTATFTGCMDNEEPAGITDLRGAKAEFIRAKSAWELANVELKRVEVEKEKVAVESAKVSLEIKKLNLEKEQAATAWIKDSLQARQDTLAASVKEQLLAIQKKEADTNAELQKSLADLAVAMVTAKDEAFTVAINKVSQALNGTTTGGNGAIGSLTTANGLLLTAKTNLLDFISENKYYEANLNADILEAKAALAIQEGILEDLKGFAATPTAEWNAKLADVSKQIAEINADVVAKKEAIAKQKAEIQPVEANITKENAKLATADKSFTVPVVDAALQNELGIFASNQIGTGSDMFKKSFVMDPITNLYTMKADLVWAKQKLNDLYSIQNFVRSLENRYANQFLNAYGNVFNSYPQRITEVELAKAKAELTRLAIDKADKYKIFQNDSTAWMDAYIDYMTGLVAYENYQQTTTFEAIQAKVTAYNSLAADKKTVAEANKLVAAVKVYGLLRDKLDNAVASFSDKKIYAYTVVEDADNDLEKSKCGLTNFNNFINNSANYMLGNSALTSYFSNQTLPKDAGSIQRLIFASKKAFGTGSSLTNVVEAKKVSDKYYLPEDITPGNMTCSYAVYKTNQSYYDAFANIEKWIALDKSLTASFKVLTDQVEAINATVETLRNSIADQKDAIWKAELEMKLLDYNVTGVSFDNPYTNSVQYNACKKQALESLSQTIENAINNAGTVTYVVYDATTNSFSTMTGTIENLISQQNTAIENARDEVASKENLLAQYKTLGKDSSDRYQSVLEAEVKDAEAKVAMYQSAIDALNAQLKKLLDAYASK